MINKNVLLVIFLYGIVYGNAPLEKINTPNAPAVYDASQPLDALKTIKMSQAIKVDLQKTKELIFVSGQVALDPKTGKLLENNIQTATARTLDNIEAILKAGGSDWKYVARVDVFLKDWNDFDGMNEEYGKRFPNGIFPARQTVVVTMDNKVEISCIAIVPKD